MRRRLNNLPQEIILEILSRLPTESALDCKLVCKPWRDLVRHPCFSEMHFSHHNDSTDNVDSRNKVIIIIKSPDQQWLNEIYYTEFEFDENCGEVFLSRKTRMNLGPAFQNCSFVGSCNGLLCFISWDKNEFEHVYICNPITREYIILPNLQGEYCRYGFGYSLSTSEYKVVRICSGWLDPNCGIAQVYTVGRGNGWRNLGEVGMKYMKYITQSASVFANGALHWANSNDKMILAFHLTDEKFSEFPSPRDDVLTFYLGVLGDFLSATYYLDYDYYDYNCTSEIWILKKNNYNSDMSWSKQLTSDKYVQLSFEFPKSGTRLLCCSSDGIYSYNPKASPAEIEVGVGIYSEAILHKNTLLSLKALGEKGTKTMELGERARLSEVIESST